jgi:putative nucleotidyltransferase with HDIG domain
VDEQADHLRRLPILAFLIAVAAVCGTVPVVRLAQPQSASPIAVVLLAAVVVAAFFPWMRPHPRRSPTLLFVTLALLTVAQGFSGGGQSPLTPLFALVILAAAFYPPRATALLVGLVVLARTSFVIYDHSPSRETIVRWCLETPVLVTLGVLVGITAHRLRQASESATLLPHLAGRTALALERARSAQALQAAAMQTMVRLAEAVEAREAGTAAHCRRVAAYSVAIAGQLGIAAAETQEIERGALLHDIGKIGVPDAVLLKPAKLTEDEWVAMRRHAQIGYELLGQLPYLEHARELVYSHHERWDGNGYPRGLKGSLIPIGARIFAVADAFDAMSSDRPYRRALPPDVIVDELRHGAGSQFDAAVVAAMLRTLQTGASVAGRVAAASPRSQLAFP